MHLLNIPSYVYLEVYCWQVALLQSLCPLQLRGKIIFLEGLPTIFVHITHFYSFHHLSIFASSNLDSVFLWTLMFPKYTSIVLYLYICHIIPENFNISCFFPTLSALYVFHCYRNVQFSCRCRRILAF